MGASFFVVRPGPKPWAGSGVLLPQLPPAVAAVAAAVAVAALYPLWLYRLVWYVGPGTCVRIGLGEVHLNHTQTIQLLGEVLAD